MKPVGKLAVWGFCVVSLVGWLAARGAQVYTSTHLDRLLWTGNDINEAGEVAADRGGAFYYDGQTAALLKNVVTPDGRVNPAQLFSINNNSVMVGTCSLTTNYMVEDMRAFMYDGKTGTGRAWGWPAGTRGRSAANAINDSNVIVGEWESANGLRAARFELDGRITDLGTLGGNSSAAASINKWGDVVGSSKNAAGFNRAFVIRRNVMGDLGTLGGKEARATRINNVGDIVGAAQTANGAWHACLWSGGKVIDLVEPGDLGGDGTIATAINDKGVIVGNGQWFKVFVKYPGQKMQDLPPMVKTALFDPVFGFYQKDDYVDEAHDINNGGVILARIYHPNYSGLGVAYSATLRPGVVTTAISAGEWKITAGAPPGFEMQVDKSADLKEWTSVAGGAAESGFTHSELVQTGAEFFRIVVKAQP